MNLGLDGKIAFVAGASAGMGKAIARELASEGAKVAIGARTEARLQATAAEIMAETGSEVLPLVVDVTNVAQIEEAIEKTVAQFGGLQILVTNGGSASKGNFNQLDHSTWQQGWELYFMMHVNLIRTALPHLRANRPKWGRIITVTSISAQHALQGLFLSSTLRPGVEGVVRSLASELAPEGITVNNLAPGYVLTEQLQRSISERAAKQGISKEEVIAKVVSMTPVGRISQPEEQAAVVAFLASTRAAFITGQTIVVGGGMIDNALSIW